MKYRVLAVSAGGLPQQLRIEAPSPLAARAQLTQRGLRVVKISDEGGWRLAVRKRSAPLQTTTFAQELVALLEAGLTITEAIEALAAREKDPGIRALLAGVSDAMKQGGTFSEALEQAGGFPRMMTASVRASERSGGLADALRRYAEYANTAESLRATVRAALMYPGLLLLVGAAVVAFLLGFVVPRFSEVYREAGRDLPVLSQMLLAWGSFARQQWALALAMVAGALAGLAVLLRHLLRSGLLRRALLAVPALEGLLRSFEHIRLYRGLALLLRAGIPLAQALEECLFAVPDALAAPVRRVGASLREGQRLSDALEREGLAGGIALRLVQAGEQSGGLAQMLERAAGFEESHLGRTLGALTKLVEPLLMALLGVIIGGIVVLMYLPIFDLAAAIE